MNLRFPRIASPLPAYSPVAVSNANVISFVKNDPLGVGVTAAAAAAPGSDSAIEVIANALSPSFQVPNDPITATALLNLVNATDFNAMTTAQQTEFQTILSVQSITIGLLSMQQKLNALFSTYQSSLVAIQSQYTRAASPWEYWFGAGQQASNSILDSARNSGSGNNF